jgi:anthranilate phosphoribosyltransferase
MDVADAVGPALAQLHALEARTPRLDARADAARPIVLPAYDGTRAIVNQTPLLALLLRRYEIPVLVHGGAASPGAVGARAVLAELGVAATADAAEAQARLLHDGLAYFDLGAPADERLARLFDPFAGDGYRVIGVASAEDLGFARKLLAATRADALLFRGAEGQPFVDPRRPVPLEQFTRGAAALCEQADDVNDEGEAPGGAQGSVAATAEWTERALVGEVPIPATLLTELACCLAGVRR